MEQERKIAAHPLAGFGGTFGYQLGDDADPLGREINGTVAALVALDQQLAAGGEIEAQHVTLQIRQQKAQAAITAARERVAKATAALHNPPASEAPAADTELRQWVAALTPERRAQVFAEMGKGLHPGVLQALARFAAPHPDAETARRLYEAQRQREHPKEARALAQQQATIDWATSTSDAITRVVDAATTARKLPASLFVRKGAR